MKRKIALVLSIVLLVTSVSLSAGFQTTVSAKTQAELEAEIDRLDQEIENAEGSIDDLDGQKADEAEKLAALQSQLDAEKDKVEALQAQVDIITEKISVLDKQLSDLNQQILDLKTKIENNESKIMETQAAIEKTSSDLEAQIRASYMSSEDSILEIFMGSDSLSTFLSRLEMMKRVSEQKTKTINDFKEISVKLENLQIELEKDKADLDTKYAALDKSKNEAVSSEKDLKAKMSEYNSGIDDLMSQSKEVQDYISSLDTKSKAYQDYIAKQKADREAADKALDEAIENSLAANKLPANNDDSDSSSTTTKPSGSSTPAYNTGTSWAWPLGNASCYISSQFGYRDASISGWSFHGGTDITGGAIYGKPVYATRAGTVITAQSWDKGGYGIYPVVDHGDGFISIYGHCSKIIVSVGQKVEKGQVIAYVGSSGNSTGAHLHFEIRQNGTKVNPMNYVKKP